MNERTNEDGTPAEKLPLCDYCEDEMPGERYLNRQRDTQYCSLECKLADDADVLTDVCAKTKERAEKAEAALKTAREDEEREGRENQTLRARVAELEEREGHFRKALLEMESLEEERDGYRSGLADMVACTNDVDLDTSATFFRNRAIDALKNGPAKRTLDSVSTNQEKNNADGRDDVGAGPSAGDRVLRVRAPGEQPLRARQATVRSLPDGGVQLPAGEDPPAEGAGDVNRPSEAIAVEKSCPECNGEGFVEADEGRGGSNLARYQECAGLGKWVEKRPKDAKPEHCERKDLMCGGDDYCSCPCGPCCAAVAGPPFPARRPNEAPPPPDLSDIRPNGVVRSTNVSEWQCIYCGVRHVGFPSVPGKCTKRTGTAVNHCFGPIVFDDEPRTTMVSIDEVCAALGWSRVPVVDALQEIRLNAEALRAQALRTDKALVTCECPVEGHMLGCEVDNGVLAHLARRFDAPASPHRARGGEGGPWCADPQCLSFDCSTCISVRHDARAWIAEHLGHPTAKLDWFVDSLAKLLAGKRVDYANSASASVDGMTSTRALECIRNRHRDHDEPEGGPVGNCHWCNKPWPCADYVDASAALDALRPDPLPDGIRMASPFDLAKLFVANVRSGAYASDDEAVRVLASLIAGAVYRLDSAKSVTSTYPRPDPNCQGVDIIGPGRAAFRKKREP